jgi:hypothetical protein
MIKKSMQVSKAASSDYGDFLKSVRPVGLGLRESSCKLNRDSYAELLGKKNKAGRLISTEYKLSEAEPGYFDATAKFSLAVVEHQKATPALTIDALYESHFHCEAAANRELVERFVASELRLVMWPYFRELVFDFCGKMSIAPITIPLAASVD